MSSQTLQRTRARTRPGVKVLELCSQACSTSPLPAVYTCGQHRTGQSRKTTSQTSSQPAILAKSTPTLASGLGLALLVTKHIGIKAPCRECHVPSQMPGIDSPREGTSPAGGGALQVALVRRGEASPSAFRTLGSGPLRTTTDRPAHLGFSIQERLPQMILQNWECPPGSI